MDNALPIDAEFLAVQQALAGESSLESIRISRLTSL
jgi:hypothetical protein